MDMRINNYMEEVKNDFLNKYLNEMDNKVFQMVNHLGYEGNLDNLTEWLNEKRLGIRMDEYNEDGVDMKSIYLEDSKTHFVYSVFFIHIEENENGLSYRMSDVFCQNID